MSDRFGRPLREVLSREPREGYVGVWEERLSCGHVRAIFDRFDMPRRRRCHKCARETALETTALPPETP